ncbi:MAG: aminoacyl-histidine dipeptidase [Acidobacteriota bacterium]
MTFVSDLEPSSVWRHFDQILTIPRGSKNEGRMRDYVLQVASRLGLETVVDDAGNVLVRKPAAGGATAADTVVLQCHLDMVNEKNSDVDHDFSKDPIHPARQDRYLTAEGTTLGADNGIGIAICLAVLEAKDLRHGPLECLFTVDEETGLTGAAALSADWLKGRFLLNLDSEEEDAAYIGCAGGSGQNLTLAVQREPVPSGSSGLHVEVRGLKGGHSGTDIQLQRANAIQLLARLLHRASLAEDFAVSGLQGGNMRNAIPREAGADLVVASGRAASLESSLQQEFERASAQFQPADPGMELVVKPAVPSAAAVDRESGGRLLRLLHGLPNGVMAMSYDIPDLVETSTNLATAKLEDECCRIHLSSRSSSEIALKELQLRIAAVAELAGCDVETVEGYPGWQPDLHSPLLAKVKVTYARVFGSEPQVRAIHAGLECGIIKQKYPQLDMISIGPQIEFPHSPDERVDIASVGRFYQLVRELLQDLAQ